MTSAFDLPANATSESCGSGHLFKLGALVQNSDSILELKLVWALVSNQVLIGHIVTILLRFLFRSYLFWGILIAPKKFLSITDIGYKFMVFRFLLTFNVLALPSVWSVVNAMGDPSPGRSGRWSVRRVTARTRSVRYCS